MYNLGEDFQPILTEDGSYPHLPHGDNENVGSPLKVV